MPLSPVEEIKSRLDIVDVIQGYVRLAKAGVNYRALCPFHNEKTPSFFVSPSRQSWHCFGACDTGGDVISFVERIEGIEFREALKMLADRAGVRLPAENPRERSEREKILGILEEAATHYENQLAGLQGREAFAYMASRGLNPETVKTFRLGYAPDDWRALLGHLIEIGFAPQDIEKAGLALRRRTTRTDTQTYADDTQTPGENASVSQRISPRESTYYDRFRNRIMFPLFDVSGRVIGFTGRVMPGGDETQGKYVNTPQTPVFDKGRFLYGLHVSKTPLRKFDYAIVVEGQMDLLMSWQAGVQNVVATSGTALTPWHLTLIKRYTPRLMFAFDMDTAGEHATKRAIDLAQEAGFAIKIIRLPHGKDAAELVRENPVDWLAAIKGSVSLLDFYFAAAFGRNDAATAEGKKVIAGELLPVLRRIPHAVEQAHWLGVLAEQLGVRENDLRLELAKIKAAASHLHPAPTFNRPAKTRKDLLVTECAAYCSRFPERRGRSAEKLPPQLLAFVQRRTQDQDVQMRSDFLADDGEASHADFEAVLEELCALAAREELNALQLKLAVEERAGRWEAVEALAQEIRTVSEQLK